MTKKLFSVRLRARWDGMGSPEPAASGNGSFPSSSAGAGLLRCDSAARPLFGYRGLASWDGGFGSGGPGPGFAAQSCRQRRDGSRRPLEFLQFFSPEAWNFESYLLVASAVKDFLT